MIKNKKHLIDEIMGQSRHQFIYGYNGKEREEFLKEAITAYPITLDLPNPVGIYICDKGLPELPQMSDELNKVSIDILNRGYVEYLIAFNVIDTAIQQIDKKILADRSKEFLDRVNKLFISEDREKATSLIELLRMLEEAKELYYNEYVKYIKGGNLNDFYDKVSIRIIMMEHFIEYFKRMINTTSYLGIIFDQQNLLSKGTQKAINNYVGSRINANMSMNIACEPEEWKTYYNQNGVLVEATHDYGCVELDSCHRDYIEKIKKRRGIIFD